MPKSQYPNNFDSSKELPPVRENITEISGDIINSLRSAIIQIERTLGLNPQGSTGNTVSSRIDSVIENSGGIKSSALTQAGVISGPIHNSQVSESAAILEKKLKLDFPTKILQSEINDIQREIDTILIQLQDIIARFSAHVNTKALDRHKAFSITVEDKALSPSGVATKDFDESSLQDAIELIYNSHINYTGSGISSVNNSHLANQIFFDNSNVNFTDRANMQNALEDLGKLQSDGLKDTILNLNSNGRVRTGSLISNYEERNLGLVLAGPASISYSSLTGSNKTTILFETSQAIDQTINRYDVLTISGSINSDDNRGYLISDVTLDVSGDLLSVDIFGAPLEESADGLIGIITRASYRTYNPNGLNAAVRPRINKSNTPVIQIANPASATIITNKLAPEKINSTTKNIDITLDGGSPVTFDVYDSTISEQSRDSIINKINDTVVANDYNFLAYPINLNNCKEIAIAHSIPDMTGDSAKRSLKISASSSNDASSALGFTSSLDLEVCGDSGHNFHINGALQNSFSPIASYTGSDISFSSSTFSLDKNSGSFFADGLKLGQIVIITGTTSDDGTYYINGISSSSISLESSKLNFSSDLTSDVKVYIYDLGANIGDLNFEESAGSAGSILFDVIMDERRSVSFNKRIETDDVLESGGFTAIITDVSKNFIVSNETASIEISASGYATLTDPLGQSGEAVFVAEEGYYKIFSGDNLFFIEIYSKAISNPSSTISANIYGFTELSSSVLHICRGTFSATLGIILGEGTGIGVPVLKDKRKSGTIDETIISETFIEKYIEGPRNELVSSGIISGCGVSNISYINDGIVEYYTFNVSSGVALINGRRIEFPGRSGARVNATSSNNFYIVLDESGCLDSGLESTTYSASGKSPFIFRNVANLARIEGSSSSPTIYDTRIFIDKNTLKVANKIIISPEPHAGHFQTIKEGVDYCRQASKIYQNDITPTIWLAPGEHEVSETITLDFDICIEGSGSNSVIKRASTFISGVEPISSGTVPNHVITTSPENSVFLIGSTASYSFSGSDYFGTYASEDIDKGVTLKSFSYVSNDSMTNVLSFCELSQVAESINLETAGTDSFSKNAMFRFEDINFYGPSTIKYTNSNDQSKPYIASQTIGEVFLSLRPTLITVDDAIPSPLYFMTHNDAHLGNIIVKNCFFRNAGWGQGPIVIRGDFSNTEYYNIIISECITVSTAPNQTTIIPSTNTFYYKSVLSSKLNNIIEVNNIRLDEDIV